MKKKHGVLTVKILSFFMILSLLCLNGLCFAQGKAKTTGDSEEKAEPVFLATVDISLIYALHPVMQYFDQSTRLFIKPPKNTVNSQELLNIIKTRANEFKQSAERNSAEIKRLKSEIDVLNKEIEKIESYRIAELDAVNDKYDALAKDPQASAEAGNESQRASELERIGKKYNGDINEKNKKLSGLLDSYEAICRSMLKTYYLTAEETEKKFIEINSEVNEAIESAAKKYGAKAIINLGLFIPLKAENDFAAKTIQEKTKINAELEYLISNGPDYSKILGALRTFEAGFSKDLVNTRNMQYSETEYIKMLRKMQKDQDIEAVKNSFFTREYIKTLPQVRKLTANPIVYGGVDITRAAAVAVMVKNGMAEEKAAALYETVCGASASNFRKM